jgi:hypothetical protein
MPIYPPNLDDRSFEDLVEEALARIPAIRLNGQIRVWVIRVAR